MSFDYTTDDVRRYRDGLVEAIREGKESIEVGHQYVTELRSEVSDLSSAINFLPDAPIRELSDRTQTINQRLLALTNGSLENVIHQVTRFDRHLDMIEGAMPCEEGLVSALREHEHCHSDDGEDCPDQEVYCDESHFDPDYHISRDEVIVSTDTDSAEDFAAGYIQTETVRTILATIKDGPMVRANLGELLEDLDEGSNNSPPDEYVWPKVIEGYEDIGDRPTQVVTQPCDREHVSDGFTPNHMVIVSQTSSASEDFHKGWMPVTTMADILENIRQGDYQRENLFELIAEMRQYTLSTQPTLVASEWPKVKGLVR